MEDTFPLTVACNNKPDGKKKCHSTALYETINPAQGHAFYRCQKPECKGLVVLCFNEAHA